MTWRASIVRPYLLERVDAHLEAAELQGKVVGYAVHEAVKAGGSLIKHLPDVEFPSLPPSVWGVIENKRSTDVQVSSSSSARRLLSCASQVSRASSSMECLVSLSTGIAWTPDSTYYANVNGPPVRMRWRW